MYGVIPALNIPEQIIPLVTSSDKFQFEHRLCNDEYQTWLVHEKSTGKKCIAKKFLMSNPNNLELRKYYQEVITLSQIDNLFVSSIIGFTNKNPYCIFMEYSRNLTLYQALHDRINFHLSGSQKTMIAMGIAYGMMKIHQNKITEPYLCSSNVFLTEVFLPKICHLNTSNEPIKWKAPELIFNVPKARYDMYHDEADISNLENDCYKADVYAYSLILHELLTQKDPFYNKTFDESIDIICRQKKRPSIPKTTPKVLGELIQRCWSRDPESRPSFSQIYEQFESGEVFFQNTDIGEIEALRKRIRNHEINVANNIRRERYLHEIAYLPQSNRDLNLGQSLTPNPRRTSAFNNMRMHHTISPNQYYKHHHHHRHHHRSISRTDLNDLDEDFQQSKPFTLSDSPRERRSNSVKHERNQFFDNDNYISEQPLDNETLYLNNNSSDVSFSTLNSNSSLTHRTANQNKKYNIKIEKNTQPTKEKNKDKASSPKPQMINLQVFQDCTKQQFFSSLKTLHKNIHPSQYEQFFKIVVKYFSARYSHNVVLAVCDAIQKLFVDPNAMKEFINQNFYNFLPKDDSKLIGSTFEILYLLFDFSPQSFQENFSQSMSMLITKNPEKALTLISLFAKSFNKINDPWSILDLLFHHYEVFLRSDVGSEYVDVIFYLNFNFSSFFQERMDQTRQILVSFLNSTDKNAVIMTYRAICNLYDEFFKIPLVTVVNDLVDPDMKLLAVSLMLRMNDADLFPKKKSRINLTEIISPLIKIAENDETAALLLLRYLKNVEAASILLRNSLWLTKNLPSIQYTLKIFLSIMIHSNLRDEIAKIEVLPEFFTSLIKSNVIQCMLALKPIITQLNLKKKMFRNLIEHHFFTLLLDSFGSYNDDKVTISNLSIIEYLANIGETSEYLKFSDCLATLIWSKNQYIYKGAFKCLFALSVFPNCASRYKKMKLDEKILAKFNSENEKVQTFLQNLERVEISE